MVRQGREHNANGGRHARITSRLAPCGFGAICGTSRKSILRLAERDIKGGEDDCEGEGELEHVGPDRCPDEMWTFTPSRRALFILSSLVRVEMYVTHLHVYGAALAHQ